MHTYRALTANDLVDKITDDLIYLPSKDLGGTGRTIDMRSSVDTHLLNVIGEADSISWDFDLRDGWLPKSRWTRLARQYINPEAYTMWLDTIESKMRSRSMRGMALMRTNTVPMKQHGARTSRRWGSCMISMSFRRVPVPQLTLFSRTSYFGYIGYLDVTAAHLAARDIAERLNLDVGGIRFVWQIEDAQFSWKSLAHMFQDEERTEDLYDARKRIAAEDAVDELWDEHPGLFVAALWFDRFLQEDEENVKYGDMTWGGCRRVRRRYHTEVLGADFGKKFEGGKISNSQGNAYKPLPSVGVEELDFSPIYKKNAPDHMDPNEMVEHDTDNDASTEENEHVPGSDEGE